MNFITSSTGKTVVFRHTTSQPFNASLLKIITYVFLTTGLIQQLENHSPLVGVQSIIHLLKQVQIQNKDTGVTFNMVSPSTSILDQVI